jgi:ribonuclease Z
MPLRVFGPPNIADCVEGKLNGYTWNLIEEYPLIVEVYSVDGTRMTSSVFHARNRFRRVDRIISDFTGILLREPAFTVRAIQLDHQVPCLAFSIEEEFHINIDKAALMNIGLPVGPWLSELKKAVREKKPDTTRFSVSGRHYTLKELHGIVSIAKGQKISYVTDVSIIDENIEKIITFVRDSDTLYCEAYFLDKDRDRAVSRFHLTAKITGMIARKAFVKNLVAMHFSPKYRNSEENPEEEAMREFRQSPV